MPSIIKIYIINKKICTKKIDKLRKEIIMKLFGLEIKKVLSGKEERQLVENIKNRYPTVRNVRRIFTYNRKLRTVVTLNNGGTVSSAQLREGDTRNTELGTLYALANVLVKRNKVYKNKLVILQARLAKKSRKNSKKNNKKNEK